MRPPFSPTESLRRVMAVAVLTALPPLALTVYAVGPRFGLLWLALAALLMRRVLRGAPSTWWVPHAALALWAPTVAVMLVWAMTRLPVRQATRRDGLGREAAGRYLLDFATGEWEPAHNQGALTCEALRSSRSLSSVK